MVARHQVLGLELLPGAELSGPEQRDEVVQLAQVVLERRGGEQQDEIALDFLDELIGRAAVTLHLVRLVHDHQVPAVPQDLLGVPARARAIVRDDRFGDAWPVVGIGRGLEALEEFLLELPLPLAHQRGRREDQRAPGQAADRELFVNDARLDRLTEAHLVGQDGAAAHVAQHPLGHVDLVGQLLDGVGVECNQPVEPGNERDPFGLAPQLVPGALGRRLLERIDEQFQGPFVDRPGLVGQGLG